MYLFLIKSVYTQIIYVILRWSILQVQKKKHFTITVVLRSFRFRSYIYQ